jgi:hypothetical protein
MAMDDSSDPAQRDSSPERGTEDSSSVESPQSWAPNVSIDDIAKIVAFVSVLLYGILFIGYRTYYEFLNISPEDVGVTSTFVLVRSPGFIALFLTTNWALTMFLIIPIWSYARSDDRAMLLRTHRTGMIVIGVAVLATLFFLDFPFPILAPLLVPLIIGVAVAFFAGATERSTSSTDRHAPVPLIVFTVILSLVATAILVFEAASEKGRAALAGESVDPMNFEGIPVLDVAAPSVEIYWADPRQPHIPKYFGDGAAPRPVSGLLFGQANNVVIANVKVAGGYEVVRFNGSSIIVVFK